MSGIATEVMEKLRAAVDVLGIVSQHTSTNRDNELHAKADGALTAVESVINLVEERDRSPEEKAADDNPLSDDGMIERLAGALEDINHISKVVAAGEDTQLDQAIGRVAVALHKAHEAAIAGG